MTIKGVSDAYAQTAKSKRNLFIFTGLLLNAMLLAFFMLWYLEILMIGLSGLIAGVSVFCAAIGANGIVMAVGFARVEHTGKIGKNLYVTFADDGLSVTDTIKNETVSQAFAWADISRVIIDNATPFDKFNKNKAYIVAFVADADAYERYAADPRAYAHRRKNRLAYMDKFFFVMLTPEVADAVKTYWHGDVETTKLGKPEDKS